MSKIFEQSDDWAEWVASRPPVVKAMCERWPDNLLYRMKDTGQRVFIISYSENGTVTVGITGKYNKIAFEREVFGVDPAELVECALPLDDEPLGVTQTEEETKALLDMLRKMHKAMKGQGYDHS